MDRVSRFVRAAWVAGLVSLLVVGAGPARAAFPGANGRLVVQPANGRGLLWSVKPIPLYAASPSLSCVSARFCLAVGQEDDVLPRATAMRWDGKRWRLDATPDPNRRYGPNNLIGVSCTSSRDCVGVGSYVQSVGYDPAANKQTEVDMPFAERWNGLRWSLLPFPGLPPAAQQGGLGAVSCISGRACMAVGVTEGLFAARWDGRSWSVESMPLPAGATNEYLADLSCPSATFCIAVGLYTDPVSGLDQPLAEQWNGSTWSLSVLARGAGPDADLNGVSCTSRRACTAVGAYSTPPYRGTFQPFAERWDGTRWWFQKTPSFPSGWNDLWDVSCTSSRACTAVGTRDLTYPLVERWDGTSWSVQRIPNARSPRTTLQAVSCTSSAICTAVGTGSRTGIAEQSRPAQR